MLKNFVGRGIPLSNSDLLDALKILDMDEDALPVLWAVLSVESRGFGFSPSRRPKILFERHIFFRETNGRFESDAPDLCARTGGGYKGGDAEYSRLEQAIDLCKNANIDPSIALKSASWGLGQVMGFNAGKAGFDDVTAMVQAMTDAENRQLSGMVQFMRANGLHQKLKDHNWGGFAKGYNGASYWKNAYDVKLKAAFDKFSSGISRDLQVRAAQAGLLYLGYKPGEPDGVLGQNTWAALTAFCKKEGLQMPHSYGLDDALFQAILKKSGL